MLLPLLLITAAGLQAQSPSAAARSWVAEHRSEVLAEFRQLLSIPNRATDIPNIRRNADAIEALLRSRGVVAEQWKVRYAPPVVFGRLDVPGAERTLVFYAHYDGQPVQAANWRSGDAFEPLLLSDSLEQGGERISWDVDPEQLPPEARIYARSAGDDKAPVIALLTALDALRAAGIQPACNLRFFFEGEEEMGSAHLEDFLERNREALDADLWIFCDGPRHQNRQQQVVFGVRGMTGLELTVYGPRVPLHSGHYGNWAPNPGMLLARLLTSFKDAQGRVLVDGFYEQVAELGPEAERALASAPDVSAELARNLWIRSPEGGGKRLDELLTLPSFNVRGLASAAVGPGARNVIPVEASASVDIRLVPGMDPEATLDRVEEHVRQQGFHVVDREPDGETRAAHDHVAWIRRRAGYPALRTAMDSPESRAVVAAVERARGPVVRLPTLGGSLPLYLFEKVLGQPVVIVPIANHDNNQHAADENMRLVNLWEGIETMAELLAMDLP